jgi:hypothetical protein
MQDIGIDNNFSKKTVIALEIEQELTNGIASY